MKVLNIHKRTIAQPKKAINELLKTLATPEDCVWPRRYWPPMYFKEGLKPGAKGGHGIIRYSVEASSEDGVTFKFSRPLGFKGHHGFEVIALGNNKTQVIHTIRMTTHGRDTWYWVFVIRWLHDALTEDALDNIETYFSKEHKRRKWSLWVKLWRLIFKVLLK